MLDSFTFISQTQEILNNGGTALMAEIKQHLNK
jgi:hypothetical protein